MKEAVKIMALNPVHIYEYQTTDSHTAHRFGGQRSNATQANYSDLQLA